MKDEPETVIDTVEDMTPDPELVALEKAQREG